MIFIPKINVKLKLLSRVRLFATPWTIAYQAPPSMGFSRQEHWSGLPFPSPGDLPNPGIEPWSPALQTDALRSELPGKPMLITANATVVKNLLADAGDTGSIPGLGRSPEKKMATHSRILPGRSHGQRSLVGYSPWDDKELEMTEHAHTQ